MILKRGKRYGVRIWKDGRQVWVGTYDKKGRVDGSEEGTAHWAEKRALEEDSPVGQMTCDDYVDFWLEHHARPEPSTQRTYRYALGPFKRDFAGKPLKSVDRVAARKWGLAKPASQIHVIRSMFSDAMNDGLVTINPFLGFRTHRNPKKPDYIPTEKEVYDLADKALEVHGDYGAQFRAMILFAAYSGMRPGEIYPLTWDDIDFHREQIRVTKSRDSTGKVKRYTKNKQQRTIFLAPPAAAALDTYDRLHDELVFATKHGRMFSKSQLDWYWVAVRSAFGKPNMRFYDLRHTCATFLLERGLEPFDVATQLGHTDGGTLVRTTYGHPQRSAHGRMRAAYQADVVPITGVDSVAGR